MYVPDLNQIQDISVIRGLIRTYPLATVLTIGDGSPEANHIPLILHEREDGSLLLQGHVARNNPLWLTLTTTGESLAIFHGPHAYISPSWYPSKKETGRVVPTWNYMTVHAHGSLRSIEDPQWIRQHLKRLTAQQEDGLPEPWALEDAPPDFVESMIKAIVGIELSITRLVGKSKTSQNQTQSNTLGVIQGLQQRRQSFDLEMADWIAAQSQLTNSKTG